MNSILPQKKYEFSLSQGEIEYKYPYCKVILQVAKLYSRLQRQSSYQVKGKSHFRQQSYTQCSRYRVRIIEGCIASVQKSKEKKQKYPHFVVLPSNKLPCQEAQLALLLCRSLQAVPLGPLPCLPCPYLLQSDSWHLHRPKGNTIVMVSLLLSRHEGTHWKFNARTKFFFLFTFESLAPLAPLARLPCPYSLQ